MAPRKASEFFLKDKPGPFKEGTVWERGEGGFQFIRQVVGHRGRGRASGVNRF